MTGRRRKAPPGCYWRGVTLWGRALVNGKDYRWSLKTDDPRVASERRKTEKARLVAIERGEVILVFGQAVQRWETEWLRPNKGAKTATRYLCSIGQLSQYVDGRSLDQIDARLIASLIKERRSKDITNATIKRDLVALSSVFNFAIDEGWLEDNPVLQRMRRVGEKRHPIVLPTTEDIELMVEAAPGMVKDLIRVATATGAREDELISASPRQVDHARRQMTLIGKGHNAVKKLRVVDLGPFGAYELIRALAPSPTGKFLFWHHDGDKYRGFSSQWWKLSNRVERIAAKRGLDFRRFRFHDLRHFHSVQWLKAGRSIYHLRDRLGHSSIKTTEGYCRFLTPEELLAVQGLSTREVVTESTTGRYPK